jgi:VCBS repeat protein
MKSLRDLFVAGTLLLALAPAVSAQVDFHALRVTPETRDGYGQAVVDLDRDGNLDLATVDRAHLLVQLGDGRGGFEPARVVDAGTMPFAIAAGDLNGDGRPDLVVTDTVGSVALAFVGDGEGGVALARTLSVGGTPRGIALADVNGDGRLDVVTANASTGDVSVLLAEGPATFAPERRFAVGTQPRGVAIADFDQDGRLDLATVDQGSSTVSVLLGDGTGSFALAATLDTLYGPQSIVAARLDADTIVDIAVSTASSSRSVCWFLGRGDGSFGARADLPVFADAPAIAAADLNEDGNTDLVVTLITEFAGASSVLFGDGTGTFTRSADVGPIESRALAVGDFDRDGHVDASAPPYLGFGDGTGRLREAPLRSLPIAGGSCAVGDLDGDGHLDVLAGELRGSDLHAIAGLGDGRLGDDRTTTTSGLGILGLLLGDLDEDGRLDAVTIEFRPSAPPAVVTLRGDGSRGFVEDRVFALTGSTPQTLAREGLALADLDGDGHLDVVAVDRAADALLVLLGDGLGNFAPPSPLPTLHDPIGLAVGDFDEDGDLDLAVTGNLSENVQVFAGDGLGGFAPSPPRSLGHLADLVVPVDFDRDGHLDLAVSDIQTQTISICRGDGAGGFAFEHEFPVCGEWSMRAADLDDDGRTDLAVAALSSRGCREALTVLHGDGEGSVVEERRFRTAQTEPVALAIGDLDEDGHPDVVLVGGDRCCDDVVGSVACLVNTTPFARYACRAGNVNARVGPPANVLMVNGRKGFGPSRTLVVNRADPFTVRVLAPPSRGTARFALYAWMRTPIEGSQQPLPYGLGETCLPTFLAPAPPALLPRVTWNNLGFASRLGAPTLPSSPAPSLVVSRPHGVGRRAKVYLQGIVEDSAAPNGRAAVTNGVFVDSR